MRARSVLLLTLAAAACAGLTWVGYAPIHAVSRSEIFEIPKGTWARRMSGTKVEILPDHIRLTLGVRDVLVLRNQDVVPQIFGPTLMMPGQSFELPFQQASVYEFACTAHLSGQLTIIVEPYPRSPWARIHWRALELLDRMTKPTGTS